MKYTLEKVYTIVDENGEIYKTFAGDNEEIAREYLQELTTRECNIKRLELLKRALDANVRVFDAYGNNMILSDIFTLRHPYIALCPSLDAIAAFTDFVMGNKERVIYGGIFCNSDEYMRNGFWYFCATDKTWRFIDMPTASRLAVILRDISDDHGARQIATLLGLQKVELFGIAGYHVDHFKKLIDIISNILLEANLAKKGIHGKVIR